MLHNDLRPNVTDDHVIRNASAQQETDRAELNQQFAGCSKQMVAYIILILFTRNLVLCTISIQLQDLQILIVSIDRRRVSIDVLIR